MFSWKSPTILGQALSISSGSLVIVLMSAVAVQRSLADWDRAAAAQYLDDRMNLWFSRATQLQTGDGQVTCLSCHTVVPYMLARPALRQAMQTPEPTAPEARLLENISRRVTTGWNRASMSDARHGGEHGTEEVLNALILARHDANEGRLQASDMTRRAFRQLWETQRADGAWDWMDFAQEPDESAGARYYGAALAAVAVGTVPTLWAATEGYSVANVGRLRGYLRENYARQNLYNQVWMLLAAARWPGLLTQPECDDLIAKLKLEQNRDGGWSLYRLGPWRWSKAEPPFGPAGQIDASSLREQSDGYATGLISYVLLQARVPAKHPALVRATGWLKANQQDIQVDQHRWKCWQGSSLNRVHEPGGSHGSGWERMMMSDLATAFSALALLSVEQAPGL
jgi:squalene-hopene/tetraprenyl-beta-curcumene cyclase